MNLITNKVTEVLSKPKQYKDTDMWTADVMAESWGRIMQTTCTVWGKDEAEKVIVGYEFEA